MENTKMIALIAIMACTLVGVAFFTDDCDEMPTQPETLSEKYNITEIVEEYNRNKPVEIDIDELTFPEAFNIMRRMKGPDATFHWNGNNFSTIYLEELPTNWVKVGGDMDDNLFCPENVIDACGICGGNGIQAWFVDNDQDGIGDEDTMVLLCNKPQ